MEWHSIDFISWWSPYAFYHWPLMHISCKRDGNEKLWPTNFSQPHFRVQWNWSQTINTYTRSSSTPSRQVVWESGLASWMMPKTWVMCWQSPLVFLEANKEIVTKSKPEWLHGIEVEAESGQALLRNAIQFNWFGGWLSTSFPTTPATVPSLRLLLRSRETENLDLFRTCWV